MAGPGGKASMADMAIHGTLAASVRHILPACVGWEDTLWALTRCRLEADIDARLGAHCGLGKVFPSILHPQPAYRLLKASDVFIIDVFSTGACKEKYYFQDETAFQAFLAFLPYFALACPLPHIMDLVKTRFTRMIAIHAQHEEMHAKLYDDKLHSGRGG